MVHGVTLLVDNGPVDSKDYTNYLIFQMEREGAKAVSNDDIRPLRRS